MPKTATDRLLLRALLVIGMLFAAAVGVSLLATRSAPPPVTTAKAAVVPLRPAPWSAAAGAMTPSSGPTTTRVIVNRNDTLDRIFRRLSLSLADLASLRSLPGIRAHLDRLRPGEALTLKSKSGSLVGLERRLNIDQTLKVDRSQQGFTANVLQNPLATRTRTISGTIDSSLFESVTSAGGHDQTALGLADIFGYDIDFVLDIQPGDSFVVTYTEVLQDGKYLQDGPVLAARFVNQGKEYLAVRYVGPSGNADYYSPQGRSLHKAFLRAPLEFTRVSSPFSLHRQHPILNTIRAHKGVDYAAPIGTPVRAAGDGRVLFAGRRGGYGNLVELDHSRGITTVYGHLSRFAQGLHPGQHVNQGQVIAFVGMTGLATGPHLHYEYRVNGVFKNPQTVKFPEALPIDGPQRADFLAKSAPLLASLNPPPGPSLVSR
ncbi:MAG TPA: peptidoglycan DD-metalloendopeptidase family protein [Steroidobacteraceae bacterium]|nr:peptidoglycan DD-metalloendopeptidase family protein [Steroidobacteraceae bacterium]